MKRYIELANTMRYNVSSFLVYPALEVCLERAAKRIVPDINYEIDTNMIQRYWSETVFVNNEMKFTDTALSPVDIAESIIETFQYSIS